MTRTLPATEPVNVLITIRDRKAHYRAPYRGEVLEFDGTQLIKRVFVPVTARDRRWAARNIAVNTMTDQERQILAQRRGVDWKGVVW